ncbi:MAG: TadE/TadG family type IV pilus assembly protein [Eubacterium sp.]
MKSKMKKDSGVMIVEATLVFPVVFFVLIFLIYFGNVYYLKARIDNYVAKAAIEGAARCVDPLLTKIETENKVPTTNNDIKPYYSFGSMESVKTATYKEVTEKLDNAGFFKGMAPDVKKVEVNYNNYLLYATYSVEASYVIEFPSKFLGREDIIKLDLSSRSEAPVDDTAEFIRNTNMVIDYMESSKTVQNGISKIKSAIEKVKGFFSKED